MADEKQIMGIKCLLVKAGLGNPSARAFVIATAVGIGAYLTKVPSACFDEEGQMRPFAAVSKAPTATYAHFLAVPVTAAAIRYVFT